MREDPKYAAGYNFVRINARHYDGKRPGELEKMAAYCAGFWNPHDDAPNAFALGAAAGLLELAERRVA